MVILLVPIRLDALFVAFETMVTEAFADFSRLPYCQNRTDYNPDTANISESILSKPFQNQNLNLRQGIHLHWTLPDALTKGGPAGNPDSYPQVPNRWLVTKRLNGTIVKQWIVESDYLQATPENYGGIAFPEFNPGPDKLQPFNYLGRQLDFKDWKEDPTAKRLPRLTAMGYGEPAFAAFYPNCHSVFGCYDPDITDKNLKGLTYQVIGWHSDPNQDPYHILKDSEEFRKYLFAKLDKAGNKSGDTGYIQAFFKQKLGWLIPLTSNDPASLPESSYCYAQLDFEPGKLYQNLRRQGDINLSIGNTGTEAMSAYLASGLAAENVDRLRTEEQLESLLAYRDTSSKQLDLGSRIKEARHEKSFKAEKGGHIWEIRPSHEKDEKAAENDKQEVTIDLPPILISLLNTLNEQQQESDQLASLLKHRKHMLFADWYKYMLCAYPADDSRADYPDIDLVKNFIEQTLLVEPAVPIQPAVMPEIRERIRQFNESDIPALITAKFHKKDIANLPPGLTIDNIGDKWIENLPFSEYCLQFNKDSKDKQKVSLSMQNGGKGAKAISMWINLASKQAADATLLSTKNQGPLISTTHFSNSFRKLAVNGKIIAVSRQPEWRLLPKEQWFHLHIEWEDFLTKDDIIFLFSNNDNAFLQGKLASLRTFENSLTADELLCDMNILGHLRYDLKAEAGPRYWQPTEPVIVLEGAAVKPAGRQSAAWRPNDTNELACQLATVANYPLQQADLDTLLSGINKGKPVSGEDKPGFNTWSSQPWNPFLLEWQVEVHPMAEAGNLNTDNRDFDPAFITTNYSLPPNQPELSAQPGKKTTRAAALYTGRSILTPHAQTRFLKSISTYLAHLKQDDCYQALVPPVNNKEKQYYNEQLKAWYDQRPSLPNDGAMPEDKAPFDNYNNWYLKKPVFNNPIQGLLTKLSSSKTDISGWGISWNVKDEGTIQSVIHDNNTTRVDVVDPQNKIIEVFTIQGTTVTTRDNNTVKDPDKTILVRNRIYQSFADAFPQDGTRLNDFNYTLIQAALKLTASHFLSQALSGFNNALLMHRQTLQLPVTDPLGFSEYRAFTGRVKDAIAGNNNLAPLPHNDFLPIRTGTMRIQKLRIIDSFGQGKDISLNQFIRSQSLSNEAFPDLAWLPPRFVPPARLDFRLLSADSDSQVMGTHPQDNPLCGWIMANHLDNSLMIYDREGISLGLIDQLATWRTSPGSPIDYQIDDIINPHLRKIVRQLSQSQQPSDTERQQKIAFLQQFIDSTDNALEHIHPEDDIHHQEIALLMGKPLAIVRAAIGMSLKEEPPVHHGWNQFRQDLESDTRNTNKLEKVIVPVRLGDRDQLNDGLIGYWIENDQFDPGPEYHSTGTADQGDRQEGSLLQLTLEKSSQRTLTLLVYPSGDIHATTGILPVKTIQIPREQYTPALKNIQITFLSAPILTGRSQLSLSLPKELGYEWSWLAKDRFSWVEIAANGIVRKDNAIITFPNGADIWQHLLLRGWITEIDGNRARILPDDQRKYPDLAEPFNKQVDEIRHWLDAGHIIPATTKAAFAEKQHITEGWLKLRPSS